VTVGAVALAGCGGDGGGGGESDGSQSEDNPAVGDVEQQGDLRLTSPAFEDGGEIPPKYGRDGEDVNPPLSVANVPSGAESLALAMDDPDAVEPAGMVWLHWLAWNISPSRTEIPERWEPDGAVVGTNDFDERGYGGPAPPDGEHTYRFKLYAVGTTLDLPDSAGKRDVGAAMRGEYPGRDATGGDVRAVIVGRATAHRPNRRCRCW